MNVRNDELPEGWLHERLGLLGIIGSSRRVHKKDWQINGVPFYRAREIVKLSKQGFVDNELYISEELFGKLSATGLVPEPGDIAITGVGTIGVPYDVKIGERFYVKDASVLIFKNKFAFPPRYLRFFFESPDWREMIHKGSAGTTVRTLTVKQAADIQIPVAPLNEQRRIVSKIESLQERSTRAREALSEVGPLLEQFRQSVLAAAFSGRLTADWRAANPDVEPASEMVAKIEEPPPPPRAKKATIAKIKGLSGLSVGLTDMPIPTTWHWTRLTRIGQLVTGHTPSRKHPEYWDGNIPWIGIKDARNNNGMVIEDTLQHVTELGLENSASRWLPKGTVLMTRTANSIGYSVVLGRAMSTSQDLVGWIFPKEINPKYIMYLLLAENDALYRFAKGSAHPTVYFPEILSLHAALPPIEEQDEIVRRVESILEIIKQKKSSLLDAREQLQILDQSILAKAFRGELVPQDPNDEPASELLERIRAKREELQAKPKKKAITRRKVVKKK